MLLNLGSSKQFSSFKFLGGAGGNWWMASDHQ
jgi:hypothetical protein